MGVGCTIAESNILYEVLSRDDAKRLLDHD
jgi:hypothetical protein